MSGGTFTVATSGKTVDRDDRCVSCGGPMLYRVDKSERVVSRFCQDDDCPLFLREAAERGEEER